MAGDNRKRKIRVLIVDDSPVVRVSLANILKKDSDIEVVGTAPDPYVARDLIVKLRPDVITLDVEMPKMDGITFLKKLMTYFPTPVVMISSLTQRGCDVTLRALELGAVDFVAKPQSGQDLKALSKEIIDKVKAAARVKVVSLRERKPVVTPTLIEKKLFQASSKLYKKIIAIGASTGGTEALKSIFSALPANMPGTLVVLHMPPGFTKAYAERLDGLSQMKVKEAEDGEKVEPGKALIAKGNLHMVLNKRGANYVVRLKNGPLVHGCRPSVDVLFNSVAMAAGKNAIGVILTGMGKDGAEGMLAMKKAGAYNIAQDEKTCVIFGMPKEAIKLGAVDEVLPLDRIPKRLVKLLSSEYEQEKGGGT